MKRKILWILLIITTISLIYITYVKIEHQKEQNKLKKESEHNIYPDKKVLSVWDSYKKETYDENQNVIEERKIISLVFYEDTVKICVQKTNVCKELKYIETDTEIEIENSDKISFSGKFKKIKTTNINTLTLEKIDINNVKEIYYFSKPAG